MFRIALANMPFAALQRPSIALTQLKAVVDDAFSGRASTDIAYLNHDFGVYFGVDRYQHLVNSIDYLNSGFGDWFFRQSAFPDLPDNSDEYFQRYYYQATDENLLIRRLVHEQRPALDEFLDRLIEDRGFADARMVGFTSMFSQNLASFAMAQRIKLRNPDVVIVMGGANCEAPMGREIADNVPAVDFVFSGPALRSFPQFLEALLDGNLEACHRLDGVLSKKNRDKAKAPVQLLRRADAGIAEVGPMGEELSIDAPIRLDYGEFMAAVDRHFPAGEVEPVLTFETSRGCWWGERAHCTFCGLNGESMPYRAMSAERAIHLLGGLLQYAGRCKRFECVDNIMPRNYISEVFPFVRAPQDTVIFYEVKADISGEDLRVLSQAGVRSLQPGIEALATSTLKLMKKGTSSFGNLRFMKDCVRHDVYPEWNLLVGFPGELEEVYAKYYRDLPLLLHLPPPSGAFPVRFDRYSPYYLRAAQYGLDLAPYDFYDLIYPFSRQSLANLAYYFIDRNFGAEYMAMTARWIGRLRERVETWHDRWHKPGQGEAPRLFARMAHHGPVIHDSRSGHLVEHRVSSLGRRILDSLEKPATMDTVAQVTDQGAMAAVEDEIGWLRERGLLFEEGGRFMSLVFSSEPPLMSCQKRPADVVAERRDAAEPELVPLSRGANRVRRSSLTEIQQDGPLRDRS